MANAYLVGSYNKVILSGDLGVHIGVYKPCPDLKRNLDPKRLVDHIGAYQA
jgi:hypothetical protein